MIEKIDLTKEEWNFYLSTEKPEGDICFSDTISLPSTVQQKKKPPMTQERSDGYLTDPYRFEGYAVYEKDILITPPESDCDLFLVMERTRTSSLWINGQYVGTQNSLCASHQYCITDFINPAGSVCSASAISPVSASVSAESGMSGIPVKVRIAVDNVSCPVPGGHMTSQDTQTNWLGITGALYIMKVKKQRYENIRIFPHAAEGKVTVTGDLVGGETLDLTVGVEGFPTRTVTLTKENAAFDYSMEGAELWNEHHPVIYQMKIAAGEDVTEIRFGMREFSVSGTDFLLNGHKIFLRGKHDGMIFPMTGAAPTDIESWLKVMGAAKEHGINHYRFHTCCPPEAAFCAADLLGIYMEPELPFWGTVEEELTEAQAYLIAEGFRILDSFANHPSFFAMSLGNELWGSKERLNVILGDYKKHDPRPLYTQGSNNFQFWPCIVENDDFFVGVRFSRERLFRGSYAMCDAPLGHIQTEAPNSDYTYDAHIRPSYVRSEQNEGGTIEIQYGTSVKTVSLQDAGGEFVAEIPVVSHEVGQYFMYPDYNEIEKYVGVLKPYNLEIFRERLEQAGMLPLADQFFHASGRFAAECYKNEIETALRSKELSGFQLLDIQDFTGQGTALVGILNSFMESKGVISPEEWRSFCSDRVILGCLPKFVYASGEQAVMEVKLYSYGQEPITDPQVEITLMLDGSQCFTQTLSVNGSFWGGVFDLGKLTVSMPETETAKKAVLKINCGDIHNEYPLWIFPGQVLGNQEMPLMETASPNLTVTGDWNVTKQNLSEGRNVLYLPEELKEDVSVEGTYCTDFWNYPMFRSISESMKKPVPVGTLGLLIDCEHPALSGFPTETYSTPQWYDVVTNSRTVILDGTGIDPIVRTIDNCERNHSLGTVFEVQTGGGSLLVCTAKLTEKEASLPCMQLLKSLVAYAASEQFAPKQSVDLAVLERIFGK